MAELDVLAVRTALEACGLNSVPSDDAVWVAMPSDTYLDSNGQHQIFIAIAPRSGGLLSLWLVPDLAPPEFRLGDPPAAGLLQSVLAYQWQNQLVRFQLGDDGRLQGNIDMLVGDSGIDPAALQSSLETLVSAVDGLIEHLREVSQWTRS